MKKGISNGLLSGVLWALNAVVLGIALSMSPFISTEQAIFLAPFVSTFLNDFFSAIIMLIINLFKHNAKQTFKEMFSKKGRWVILASVIGGPIGMTGYVLSITYMGSSIAAVASAIYPAIGCVLAKFLLKEKMTWRQWLFLLLCMLGIYGISYSPELNITNFLIGLLGTAMCAIGWGVEAVIIAKGFKDEGMSSESALQIKYIISSVVYMAILLPILKGWSFTVNLFNFINTGWLIPIIIIAAICGTISYLLYYKAIDEIGASKAMALNMTYVAWSVIFSLIVFRNVQDYFWLTYVCIAVVLISGLFAGSDITNFIHFKKKVDGKNNE